MSGCYFVIHEGIVREQLFNHIAFVKSYTLVQLVEGLFGPRAEAVAYGKVARWVYLPIVALFNLLYSILPLRIDPLPESVVQGVTIYKHYGHFDQGGKTVAIATTHHVTVPVGRV